ncbi:hypothetical protein RFI_01558 [Reticulomyxa filosa]|uniref:Uncharacterized protein n=1 Tax=Reticulomyxa filosa TaxID=46433 RepID=X6PAE8_RETFI|nr:hypothetical protein RFI_01558 [Reticulomyxa filosa]|eukprot:ETO35505.1 hypothetical protein RFI_01558 [Reticulomyxa filosa]
MRKRNCSEIVLELGFGNRDIECKTKEESLTNDNDKTNVELVRICVKDECVQKRILCHPSPCQLNGCEMEIRASKQIPSGFAKNMVCISKQRNVNDLHKNMLADLLKWCTNLCSNLCVERLTYEYTKQTISKIKCGIKDGGLNTFFLFKKWERERDRKKIHSNAKKKGAINGMKTLSLKWINHRF